MPQSSSPRLLAALRIVRGAARVQLPLSMTMLAALAFTGTLPFRARLADAQSSGAQTAAPVPANAQPLTGQATAGGTVLQGTVLDPDQAEIPGATLTLTPVPARRGKAYTVKSGADGSYSFKGVPAGAYSLTTTMPGFQTYVRPTVNITANTQTIAVKMTIGDQNTVINVTADDNTVSVDPDKNVGATVLSAKDLESFSDDPDELTDELQALAGPAAGPNGGQIYIDGFTGGQLPPKSSIREIRINQNPFSAEYDRAGFGRIEVFTKPGTDTFHGQYQLNGLDRSFNTGSPFISSATPQPGYHSILMFGSVSGPISKGASFTMNGSFRQIQNNSIVDPPAIYATSQGAGEPCLPGQTGCQIFATQPGTGANTVAYPGGDGFTLAQFTPQTRFDLGPRFDVALGEKNTLTARFQYEQNSQQNQNIGGNDLYSTGYNEKTTETTLQLSDTQIISSKIINETRFEYQRPTTTITPFATTPAILVQGAFSSGGNTQQTENDVQPHYELQNYTSVALKNQFIRFGGRLRSTADQNTTTAGANGQFIYSSIADYQANVLNDFTVTNIAHPTVNITSIDLGLYAEDDWKIKPNLTFSYGLRYETQNFIGDHHDFAPRLAVSYGLTKKTVLRAGFGFFYDRFLPQNQLQVARNNGVNESVETLSSSTKAIPATCSPSNVAACETSASVNELTVNTIAPGLRAPYQIQENLGVDQQMFRNATVSVNYQHILGVHQFVSNVPNYLTAPQTNLLDYEYESEANFNQNQLIVNTNIRNFHNLTLFGYYALNFAKSDTGGIGTFASVPNDLHADYGRASFDVRSRLFMGGSYTFPRFLLTLSPFLVAQSGNPYNITAGTDEFGINQQNFRAVFANPGTLPDTPNGYVKTIPGCGTFASPGTLGNTTQVPINYCTGPAIVTFNLRAVKTFGFGGPTGPRNAQGQGGGGPQGPPGGRGPGGGGGGRGGGNFGGGASSGRRYNLSIGAQAQNLFNVVDRTTPVGVLSSPSFGTSTQLAGSLYTNDDAVRRIQLQVGFSF